MNIDLVKLFAAVSASSTARHGTTHLNNSSHGVWTTRIPVLHTPVYTAAGIG